VDAARSLGILVLALALSGCSGHQPAALIHPDEVTPPEPGMGTVAGLVVDEEQRPLSGVSVFVAGQTDRSTLTNDEGRYQLTGLEPGTHTLYFQRFGFVTLARDVRLEADAVHQMDVALVAIAVEIPYATSAHYDGFLALDVATFQFALHLGPRFDPNDNTTFPVHVDRGLKTILTGIQWEASGPASAATLQQSIYIEGTFQARAAGPSPNVLRLDKWSAPEPRNATIMVALPPTAVGDVAHGVALAYQQRFEVFLDLAYYVPAPEDATPFA